MDEDGLAPIAEITELKPAPVAEVKIPVRCIAEYVDTTQQQVNVLNIGHFVVGAKYEVSRAEANMLRQCVGFVVTEE